MSKDLTTPSKDRVPCVGIDLGTTASAIGWVQQGTPKLVSIGGSPLLPSVVLYRDGEPPLVGQSAVNALPLDPDRAVVSSKRWMGTDHRFCVGEDLEVGPVDVAEQILRTLVDAAEAELGVRPERAVITVPAWFTHAQRAETRQAGEAAGLVVERIINEPTAAALAHAHGQDLKRRVLVYDLGGGTFDVSLVEQDGPVVEVRASHGDSRLGGDDIDLALMGRVLQRMAETDPALRAAVEASTAAKTRLRLAVEAAKQRLSEATTATLGVPFLLELDGEPRHLKLELERGELEALSAPLLERTLASVDQVLADAGVAPTDLDELILVGGATLQPAVWHLLHDRYGLEGSHGIAPRDAVALGAAIQAAIVDGSRTDGILVDVAPYSLSIGVASGPLPGLLTHYRCRVITPRNAPLPARHAEQFATSSPVQRELHIHVFQGSSPDPRRNVLLGKIELDDLEPAPDHEHSRPIRVAFRHDLDGLVHIEVTDELSGEVSRGQVAADGERQAELQAELLEELDEQGLIADIEGSSPPEPTGEAGGFEASMSQISDLVPTSDADEARQTFAAVLAAEAQLQQDHSDEATELLALARDGTRAMEASEDDEALAIYDALSDRMFALGIYL